MFKISPSKINPKISKIPKTKLKKFIDGVINLCCIGMPLYIFLTQRIKKNWYSIASVVGFSLLLNTIASSYI